MTLPNSAIDSDVSGTGVILSFFDIPGARMVDGNIFPLGIQLSTTSGDKLTADKAAEVLRIIAEKGTITELLNKHGALLVRGVDEVSPRTFSALIHASEEGRGCIPYEQVGFSGGRTTVGKDIFSASEAPPHIKIDQHNEVQYIHATPQGRKRLQLLTNTKECSSYTIPSKHTLLLYQEGPLRLVNILLQLFNLLTIS